MTQMQPGVVPRFGGIRNLLIIKFEADMNLNALHLYWIQSGFCFTCMMNHLITLLMNTGRIFLFSIIQENICCCLAKNKLLRLSLNKGNIYFKSTSLFHGGRN